MGGVSSSETTRTQIQRVWESGCCDDYVDYSCSSGKIPELRSYRVVTAVINWQQKRGLALWMFCRVDTEPGTMLQ